jgi:hypothetical protein
VDDQLGYKLEKIIHVALVSSIILCILPEPVGPVILSGARFIVTLWDYLKNICVRVLRVFNTFSICMCFVFAAIIIVRSSAPKPKKWFELY